MTTCPSCDGRVPVDARFCQHCGGPLIAADGGGEVRKVVTALFTDVVGSTALAERLDPESVSVVMGRWFTAMRTVLEEYGGTVQKFIGDAILAVFGVPFTREDDALRAVHATAALQSALQELNRSLQLEADVTLAVRTGINTGEVMAGAPAVGSALVLGDAINVAARLQQAAAPGEVLLGAETWRLVRGAVEAEPTGPITVKGKQLPVAAFRLLRVTAASNDDLRAHDTPFVGRAEEQALLHATYRRTVRDSRCCVVTVLGPAGIGKSRLLRELLASVEPDARALTARCSPYGHGEALAPLRDIVREAVDLRDDAGADAVHQRLVALLGTARDAATVADTLAAVPGAESSAGAEEIAWALRRLFGVVLAGAPLVVVLDDVHWADTVLLDVFEHITDLTRDAATLFCCAGRPELLEQHRTWGAGKRNATTLLLEPLPDPEATRLLDGVVGGAGLDADAAAVLARTAEGNPLFLQELAKSLVENGVLREQGGRWTAPRHLARPDLPPTVQAVLAARLDQLPARDRDLLARCAVVGPVFDDRAVAALCADAKDGLATRLAGLVRREAIRPARSPVGIGTGYAFRHALLRDAAYAALPKQVRVELHQRLAHWLEEAAGDRLAESAATIGYHLEQAHRYCVELGTRRGSEDALAQSAAQWLAAASRRATALGDSATVVDLLRRATALLPRSDARRPRLIVEQAAALRDAGAVEEAIPLLHQVIDATGTSDPGTAWRARVELTRCRLHSETAEVDLDASRDEVKLAIGELAARNDAAGTAEAWLLLSEIENVGAHFAEMARAAEHAVEHAVRAGDVRKADRSRVDLVSALCYGPTPVPEAVARTKAQLQAMRGRPGWQASALGILALLEAQAGHTTQARTLLARGRALAAELGRRRTTTLLDYLSAHVDWLAGNVEAAERGLRAAYDEYRDLGDHAFASTVAAERARVLFELGRDDEALDLTRVSEAGSNAADQASQATWRGARATLLARQGALDEALMLADEGVRIAATTDLLDLRGAALADQATVLLAAGRLDEAAATTRRAVAEYAAKGNVAAAERVRRRLRVAVADGLDSAGY